MLLSQLATLLGLLLGTFGRCSTAEIQIGIAQSLLLEAHDGPDSSGRAAEPGRQLQASSKSLKPRLYILEMPPRFTKKTQFGDISDGYWGLEQLFFEMLRTSPYVTNSSSEADYIVPEIWYHHAKPQEDEIFELLNANPLWAAKEGRNFIFVVTSEHARCSHMDARYENSIFVSHFGHLFSNKHIMSFGKECDLLERYGDECDPLFAAGEDAFYKTPFTPCFKPKHDIVVPPTCYEAPVKSASAPGELKYNTRYIDKELAAVERKTTMFFSGVIDMDGGQFWAKERPWSDAWYSYGARQNVYRMHSHEPDFMLLPDGAGSSAAHASASAVAHANSSAVGGSGGGDDYWHALAASHFCLAPAGWGWGSKMKAAVTRGCIPVIVQDATFVEWEDQLPLKQYALRIPMWSVHKLPAILRTYVQQGWADEMRGVIDGCAWRLHWWRRPHGRAFELLMCELKRRALGRPTITVDLAKCTLECGDGKVVELLGEAYNSV